MRVFTRHEPFRLIFESDRESEKRHQNGQRSRNGRFDGLIGFKGFFEGRMLFVLRATVLRGVMIITKKAALHANDLRTEDGEREEHDEDARHGVK